MLDDIAALSYHVSYSAKDCYIIISAKPSILLTNKSSVLPLSPVLDK